MPSIKGAKKITSALGVTLDYLAIKASSAAFDRRTVERIQDIEQLEEYCSVIDAKKPQLYTRL